MGLPRAGPGVGGINAAAGGLVLGLFGGGVGGIGKGAGAFAGGAAGRGGAGFDSHTMESAGPHVDGDTIGSAFATLAKPRAAHPAMVAIT